MHEQLSVHRRESEDTYKVHLVDSQDTGVGMLALRVRCARETDALVDVLCRADRSGLDTGGSRLANLLI